MEQVKNGVPGASQTKLPTDKAKVQAAVKSLHACINELLKAGRVTSMEAAAVVIDDFQTVLNRLNEVDVLTAEVARLRGEAVQLLEELRAAKAAKAAQEKE